jgi:signal peptide peptidase SppA
VKPNHTNIAGSELFSQSIWSIRPEVLRVLTEVARLPIIQGADSIEALSKVAPKAANSRVAPAGGSSVAIIPLQGIITPRGGLLALLMGGGYGGLTGFRESLREAMCDEDVASILLVVDSPGGLIDLVPETAAEIRAAGENKKIVAIANTEASSAAYWLASQASELVVTPSGMVGSIGVFVRHEEISRMAEMEGVKITTIRAGKFKSEVNRYEPLTDEAEAHLQGMVNTTHDMFLADVAAGRGAKVADVRGGYGEGRVILAEEAVQLGMADRVATLEQVISDMTGTSPSPSPRPQAEEDTPPLEVEDEQPPVVVDDDSERPAAQASNHRQLASILFD